MTTPVALTFQRNAEWYALPAGALRGILAQPSVTPVVQAPPEILGLLSFRGEPVPLIEPSLHAPVSTPLRTASSAIVVASIGGLLAIIADSVHEFVVEWPSTDSRVIRLEPDVLYRSRRALVRPRRSA